MFGEPFYHELLSKYVAIFGTLFNDIHIKRSNGANTEAQYFKVPIEYGPREKFLAITQAKPGERVQQIQLPRMSFEITGVEYDPLRKFPRTEKYVVSDGTMAFEPVPYNIQFDLSIMVKNTSDALKIVEQIFPDFNPDWTVTAQLIDGNPRTWDIPIVRTGQEHEDAYEDDFITRRVLIWTLHFEMKGWLHGPIKQRKVIKFITVNTYPTLEVGAEPAEKVTIQPGLTANGEPTTDANTSIDYHDIEVSDNWAYIIKVEEP